MENSKQELRKLWLKAHLDREKWKREDELIHKWSMLAIEIAAIAIVIKLIFSFF